MIPKIKKTTQGTNNNTKNNTKIVKLVWLRGGPSQTSLIPKINKH